MTLQVEGLRHGIDAALPEHWGELTLWILSPERVPFYTLGTTARRMRNDECGTSHSEFRSAYYHNTERDTKTSCPMRDGKDRAMMDKARVSGT